MSSKPRRMEIRGLKARGFGRTPYRMVKDALGVLRPIRVTRGGLILDPTNQPVGYRWPRVVDLRRMDAALS
ncbi:MAG: hypothetical protein U9R64_08910 [Pseudomonadota bacterium]|nr:hypothetical protein [Pseudomonadota bacterium]